MKILVISDIHANYTALDAVLSDAGEVDGVWCLGDIVGYGPDPEACVERIRALPNLTCLLGNHDVAVIGRMPFESFNSDARLSLLWQKQMLSKDSLYFLQTLPETVQVRGEVSLVHGSPRDPVWEYIINTLAARLNFGAFQTRWCFVGHSHVQSIFWQDPKQDRVSLEIPHPGERIELRRRAILNPGSVGQPRDRDPRAAYALYDPEAHTWETRRVEYDIAAVQARIREANLPEKHAFRLQEGW